MARGRFLSESIKTDRRLNDLSVEAALVYVMAIPHLDRDGIIDGDAPVLWGTVCPRRRALLDHMEAIIAEWVTCGLVVLYDTDDGTALWFCGFRRNQQGMHYDREAKSRFAPPPGHIRTESGIVPTPEQPAEKPSPDEVRTNSGPSPAEVKVEVEDQVQEEVEVEEEVEESPAAPPATQGHVPTPQQEFYAAVCEAIGWDYKTLTKDASGRVAQTVGILKKANYTIADVRRFMTDVWFQDFRWTEKNQRPSLNVLRNEIGKIRAGIPVDMPVNGHKSPTGGAAVAALRQRMEREQASGHA